MGVDEPESGEGGDAVEARLRAARPRDAAPGLGDEVCIARIERAFGGAASVRVGEYTLEALVGEGAYGEVYRARHPRIDKTVAIKRLRPEVAQRMGAAARALREAKVMLALNHPNVVQVLDVFAQDDAATYIVMEFVDGDSLAKWQAQRRSWQEVLSVYLQAGDGLAAVHAAGVLHLDLKPGNLLVGRDGRVRVVDFGLAREVARCLDDDDTLVDVRPARGTIPYSSPEQRSQGEVDERSDQFSFCVALWEALHGAFPFSADELAQMHYVSFERSVLGARGRVPRRIDRALRRGFARDPDDRWPSMAALLSALRAPAWYQRSYVWSLGGAALVAIPVALVAPTPAPECLDPDEQLVGVWDADVRRSVAAVFEGSDKPWAPRMQQTVAAVLDAYATAWHDEMTELCALRTSAALEPDARTQMACLQRARDRLARVSSMLAEGSDELLVHGDRVVEELGATPQCLAPAEPATAQSSPDVRDAIAAADHASLWLAAGRVPEAEATAEQAVTQADRTGDAQARAEARLARGRVLAQSGRSQAALEDLREAAALAVEAGRDELAADAWRRLAGTVATQLRDAPTAMAWLRLAEAGVLRLGRPPRAFADVLDARGRCESVAGDDVAAEASHRAALVELAKVLAADDPRWAETWIALAGIAARRGAFAEAATLDRRTLELREARLGGDHPDVGDALLGLALVTRDLGEPDASLAYADRARDILEHHYGAGSVRIAPVLTLRAQLLLAAGQLDGAESAAERAWTLQREHLPVDHIERKEGALVLLIEIAEARGDDPRMLALMATGLDEARARHDPVEIAIMEQGMAWSLHELGRDDEAERLFRQVLAQPDIDPAVLAYATAGLGAVSLAQGHAADAVELLEAAIEQLAGAGDEHEPQLADARLDLARALAKLGAPRARVVDVATHAQQYFQRIQDKDAVEELERIVAEHHHSSEHHH